MKFLTAVSALALLFGLGACGHQSGQVPNSSDQSYLLMYQIVPSADPQGGYVCDIVSPAVNGAFGSVSVANTPDCTNPVSAKTSESAQDLLRGEYVAVFNASSGRYMVTLKLACKLAGFDVEECVDELHHARQDD